MEKTDGFLSFVTENDLHILNTNPNEFWAGVTSIGVWAFDFCKSLRKISIPDSVTSIGDYAFSRCENLYEVRIPNSVTSIGAKAFCGCKSLQKINIPEGVTSITSHVFDGCSSLQEINIPESVTNIGNGAFCGCKSLQKINIPEGVTSITSHAFDGCNSLQEINISEGVISIGDNAFDGCIRLKKINIPDSVKHIMRGTFAGCEALQEVDIPKGVISIGDYVFCGCSSLRKINISDSVTSIGDYAFAGCDGLQDIHIPKGIKKIGNGAFCDCKFKNIYFDGNNLIFTQDDREKLNGKTFIPYEEFLENGVNYSINYFKVKELKAKGKARFIPPKYILKVFPSSEIEKFFINNNHVRWGKLVKNLGFDKLEESEKNNTLVDFLKIYYAIGGFSENQGESEQAFEYIQKYVATVDFENPTPSQIGAEIHARFSRLALNGPYNKAFADFFMKYYKDNKEFMVFRLRDKDGELMKPEDYLCSSHNNFNNIQKLYPNRIVSGNNERDLLSPKFVAEHCLYIEYEDVEEGNELLAEIIGKYGYTQEQFNEIQNIYNKAKKITDSYVIMADKADDKDSIKFRVLEKNDPLGFILGDITDCCQHIGGAGSECVDDGYVNPNAGFIVFEESIKDEFGNFTGETRILGQAYVWYDPVEKTVCYDNIEIPEKILKELRKGERQREELSSSALMDAVEKSAIAVMKAMRKKGIEVERVTTGEGYNDLRKELSERYERETNPKAKHRGYSGYSDAKNAQYVIATYAERVERCAKGIENDLQDIEQDLIEIKTNLAEQAREGV